MTKKDYILIAKQFSQAVKIARMSTQQYPAENVALSIVKDFALMLEYNNDKFNKDKFLKACNI